jgi:EmrB/QacA subfamily drug resistance transporter
LLRTSLLYRKEQFRRIPPGKFVVSTGAHEGGHMETTTKKGMILGLACLAQFMVVLDIAIVNVALPSIKVDLDMRQSALQWVVVAYGLLLGGFLLLGGRLGDLLGRRRILLAGLIIFSGASLLAGLAESASLLIAARGLQGFGAALIAPTALSILAVTFSEGRERNWALGIFGAVGGSSASVGVIASGLLTDGPGWRWIFFINVPVGLLLIGLALRFLPADRGAAEARGFDFLGASAVTGGLLLLVYGLNRGVDVGWTSPTTVAVFAGALVLLVTFLRIESRSRSPLVPRAVLRNRTMVAADVAAFLLFGAFFSFIFLATLLMQQLLLYSPTRTGVAWLATSVTAFLAAGLAGARLVTRFGVRRLVIVGMSALVLGLLWLTRVPPGGGYLADLLPAFLLLGIGIGLAAPSVQIGALSGVAGRTVGLASGLVETMREIGGAVGIAAVSTVLVAGTSDVAEAAGPAAQQAAGVEAFQSAFVLIVLVAAAGALVAALAFPRTPRASRAPSAEAGDLAPAPDGVAARFDGLVINTDRPDQLRAWYAAAFGGEVDRGGGTGGLLSLDGVQLIFLPHSDVAGPAKEPKRILINFRVEDARAHAARLERLGSTWIRPVEPEPFGLLGTVADPDGNYVQIAQVGSGSAASKGASKGGSGGRPRVVRANPVEPRPSRGESGRLDGAPQT